MYLKKIIFPSLLVLGLACCCLPPFFHARGAADAPAPASAPVPAIIQKGFGMWAKNRDASWAFDVWKLGGFLERDNKPATLSRYFARLDQTLGSYKNYEVIDTTGVSQNSAVIYLCVNFDRATIFGRFMVYRTDRDWVVQDMDFSPKPEALMPWLAFQGGSYAQ
jgi:hypothetical protein